MSQHRAWLESASSSVFVADEPVLRSHSLINGVAIPRFGDTAEWPMHAIVRPANKARSSWRMTFFGMQDPVWNLRAREIAMAMLNPQHPAVLRAGVFLGVQPVEVSTMSAHTYRLARLARWAKQRELPARLEDWQTSDLTAFLDDRAAEITSGSLAAYVSTIRLLHQLDPLLAGGGLVGDPWPGKTAGQVAKNPSSDDLATPNIAPETWFAMVRASWTYIHEFAPDILAARERYRRLLAEGTRTWVAIDERLESYLAESANRIPVHSSRSPAGTPGTINWSLLSALIGVHPDYGVNKLRCSSVIRQKFEATAHAAVDAGRGISGGLIAEHAAVAGPDGSPRPWHPGLCPRTTDSECIALRGATYVFVAAMSMMRDSEIRDIVRGSVGEHYGAPALMSTKRKHDPSRPREAWWIIEPVAEAITVAEALSSHPSLIFTSSDSKRGLEFKSPDVVRSFIRHVNAATADHGLRIPGGSVRPHMMRKTMAMLTATEPGAEIALGIQLKHVATRLLANRVTEGYAASDPQWDKLLGTAVDQARFATLREFYDEHHAGKVIGFGPAADKITATFDAIRETAQQMVANGQARQGDARVEHDLLRKARIPIRFGKLNHCAADPSNPVGARCLDAVEELPLGHRGPLIDRCQPGRCANSIIGVEHVPIWTAEKRSLLKLVDDGKFPPARSALIQRQLDDVQAVIDRAVSDGAEADQEQGERR
ncbi:site-specific integrase [Actinoplanes rectilineatus]|uniref:site-specific integrase n=1 Tax=Actinoplanes rectilineatus TaxID=113571 RepID=UPI0005F2EFE7|nr:site-specific integrase [Actinoplanes rectilineatus]